MAINGKAIWKTTFYSLCAASFVYACIRKLRQTCEKPHTLTRKKRKTYKNSSQQREEPLGYIERLMFRCNSNYHNCMHEMHRRFVNMFVTTGLPTPNLLKPDVFKSVHVCCTMWAMDFCLVVDLSSQKSAPQIHMSPVASATQDVVLDVMYRFEIDESHTSRDILSQLLPRHMHKLCNVESHDGNMFFVRVKHVFPMMENDTCTAAYNNHVALFVRKVSRTVQYWRLMLERNVKLVAYEVCVKQRWKRIRIQLKYNTLTMSLLYDALSHRIQLEWFDDYNDWAEACWTGMSITCIDEDAIGFNLMKKPDLLIDCHNITQQLVMPYDLTPHMARFVLRTLADVFKRSEYRVMGKHLLILFPFVAKNWCITHINDAFYSTSISNMKDIQPDSIYVLYPIKYQLAGSVHS